MQCYRRSNIALANKASLFIRRSDHRTFFSQFGKKAVKTDIQNEERAFFPLSSSPIPELRARSQTVKRLCRCPVCVSQEKEEIKKASEQKKPKLVQFECPNCGYPTHCSKEHWESDLEHGKYCIRLREVNEDDHDLRSPREKSEYYLPGMP